MSSTRTIDDISKDNQKSARIANFLQRLKATQQAPAQIERANANLRASKIQLRELIMSEQVVADFGSDYAIVKADVDALPQ